MRSFAKIKASRKFPILQYISYGLASLCFTSIPFPFEIRTSLKGNTLLSLDIGVLYGMIWYEKNIPSQQKIFFEYV